MHLIATCQAHMCNYLILSAYLVILNTSRCIFVTSLQHLWYNDYKEELFIYACKRKTGQDPDNNTTKRLHSYGRYHETIQRFP